MASEHTPLAGGPQGPAHHWGVARGAFTAHQLPGSPKPAAAYPSMPSTVWGTPTDSSLFVPHSMEDVRSETAQILATVELESRKRVAWMRFLTMAVDLVSIVVLIASFPDRGHSVYYYPRPGEGCHNIWCWLAMLVITDFIYLLILLLQSINKSKLLEHSAMMHMAGVRQSHLPGARQSRAADDNAREILDELKTWDRLLGGKEDQPGASQAVLVFRLLISLLGLFLVWLPNVWFDVAKDGECHPWLFFMAQVIATSYSIILFGFLALYCCYKVADRYVETLTPRERETRRLQERL